jgi:hypothetical protein
MDPVCAMAVHSVSKSDYGDCEERQSIDEDLHALNTKWVMTLMSPVPIISSVLIAHRKANIFIMVNRCWTATVNHNIPDTLWDPPFSQL